MGKFRKMLLKTENLIALLHRHLLYFSIFSNLAPYVLTHWYARSWNVQISNVWVRIIRVIPKYYVLSIHVSTQHITWSYTVYIVCHTGWTHTVINTSLHSGSTGHWLGPGGPIIGMPWRANGSAHTNPLQESTCCIDHSLWWKVTDDRSRQLCPQMVTVETLSKDTPEMLSKTWELWTSPPGYTVLSLYWQTCTKIVTKLPWTWCMWHTQRNQ